MATKCPGCNANVKPNAKFCTKCGARLTAVEAPTVATRDVETANAESGVCANCDAPLKPGTKFCTKCGAHTALGARVEADERARGAANDRARREAEKRAAEQTRRLEEEKARREAAERGLEQERRFQAKFSAPSASEKSGGDGVSTRPHSVRDAVRRADR